MKKYLYLFFYKIYCLLKVTNSDLNFDGLNEFKAAVVVAMLQLFLLSSIYLQMVMYFHRTLISSKIDPKMWLIPLVIFLGITDSYFFLDSKKNWKQYEQEFKGYSNQIKYKHNAIVILVCATIIFLLLFSFYQLSLIDWKHG